MESTHKHNETMHVLMFAVCMHVVMLDMERHAADPLKADDKYFIRVNFH